MSRRALLRLMAVVTVALAIQPGTHTADTAPILQLDTGGNMALIAGVAFAACLAAWETAASLLIVWVSAPHPGCNRTAFSSSSR